MISAICLGQRIAVRTTDRSKRGAQKLDRYATVSADLSLLIGFMVNSFARPSVIKNLRHKHVIQHADQVFIQYLTTYAINAHFEIQLGS